MKSLHFLKQNFNEKRRRHWPDKADFILFDITSLEIVQFININNITSLEMVQFININSITSLEIVQVINTNIKFVYLLIKMKK